MRMLVAIFALLLISSDAIAEPKKRCDPANIQNQQTRLLNCLHKQARKYHRQPGSPMEMAEIVYEFCYKERNVVYEAIMKDCGKWQARRILPGYDKATKRTVAGQIVKLRAR